MSRMKTQATVATICFALLCFLPLFVTDSYIRHLMILAFIFAVVACSWDISLGYAGLFNFGHVAFFGIGVYTTGVLARKYGFDPWLALPAAGVMAGISAIPIAIPVLRLKGIYVVLVTFAFSQLCLQLVLSQSWLTGGSGGLVRIPPLTLFDYNFARDGKFAYYYVALILLVITVIALTRFVKTPFGRGILALRDNPDYAAARGINQAAIRVTVLVVSAIPAGLAGGLYCLYFRISAPEVFSFGTATLVLSMLLVGGTSTIYGPVAAAFCIVLFSEYLENFPDLNVYKHLVIAAVIIAILRLAPDGLSGLAKRLTMRLIKDN